MSNNITIEHFPLDLHHLLLDYYYSDYDKLYLDANHSLCFDKDCKLCCGDDINNIISGTKQCKVYYIIQREESLPDRHGINYAYNGLFDYKRVERINSKGVFDTFREMPSKGHYSYTNLRNLHSYDILPFLIARHIYLNEETIFNNNDIDISFNTPLEIHPDKLFLTFTKNGYKKEAHMFLITGIRIIEKEHYIARNLDWPKEFCLPEKFPNEVKLI